MTATTGSVELYATNEYVPGTPNADANLPTRDNSLWSTETLGGGNTRYSITIKPHSEHWSADKYTYALGVYGQTTSVFSVSATTSDVSQPLSLGAPSNSHTVLKGDTIHFVLRMPR